jgi:hypothetical protein
LTFHYDLRLALANLGAPCADALGAAAFLVLLVALRPQAGRGPWAVPRALPVLLLCAAILGGGVWNGYQLNNFLSSGWGTNYGYISILELVVLLVAVVLVPLYALGITDRVLGGAVLAGWAGLWFLLVVQHYTSLQVSAESGISLGGLTVAMVAAVVYARRKPAAATPTA